MIALKIILDGDNAFQDVSDKIEGTGTLTRIALLRGGMQSGASSVALLVKLEDGRRIMAQTSLMMFVTAARTMLAAGIATDAVPKGEN